MKSIGDTLRTSREERGISMDMAIIETNISRNYLTALEEENFDVFTSDAYLVGFLRNYADFLSLDVDKIIGQYRNYKLNEEPTPIEELVGPPKGSVARKVFIWMTILLALTAGGVFGVPRLITLFHEFRQQRQAQAVADEQSVRVIRPSLPLWEGEVFPGDTLILEDSQGTLSLTLSNGKGRLELDAGSAGRWSMLLGEEIYFPGENGRSKWRIYLKDLGLPDDGGVLEVQQLAEQPLEDYVLTETVDIEPPSGAVERRREPRVILSAGIPEPYTMTVAFKSFSLFRYKIDNRSTLESAFADDDSIQLNVDRTITIWASNAGAFQAKIGNEEVRLGRRGEVVVGRIRWVLDEEGGIFNLTLFPLY